MKKKIFIALLVVVFSIPVGFGIYNLIPDPVPPTPSYSVELTNTYGDGLSLSKNIAYSDYNFVADITLDRSIIKDKILPNKLGENDVLCLDKPITYTYSVNQDKFSARLTIPKENIKGKIKINVPLIEPTATFKITLNANGGHFPDGRLIIEIDNVHTGDTLLDLTSDYQRPEGFLEGFHFANYWLEENDLSKRLYENDPIPYLPEGVTYYAACELDEITVTLRAGGGAFPGGGEEITLPTLYGAHINEIVNYPGDPIKEGAQFLYYLDSNSKQYLPTDTITENNLVLTAQYRESLNITLKPGSGGRFPAGAITSFTTRRGATLGELEGYMEPYSMIIARVFTHWTYEDETGEIYQNTPLDMQGDITLVAHYEQCEHEIDGLTVVKNRLFGICKKCGARVLIKDEQLSEYTDKFLLLKDGVYELHDISDMSSLIVNAQAESVLDMYFINGLYHFAGNREGGSMVTVNAHGLFKNDGVTRNATVDCTQYQAARLLSVNLVCDNLIMQGATTKAASWYIGIFAGKITYNNCLFTGKQAIYTHQAYFNDCIFDSTNITDAPEYSIYGYSPRYGELNRCRFISQGKALKIYNETPFSTITFTYRITDCTFEVAEGFTTNKAAIEIDSTYNTYDIYLTNCKQTGYTSLWSDKSTHATVHEQ